MKKTAALLLLAGITGSLFISCETPKPAEPTTTNNNNTAEACKTTSKLVGNSIITSAYEYNATGQLTKIISYSKSTGAESSTSTYTYSSTSVTVEINKVSQPQPTTMVYKLGTNGMAESCVKTSADGTKDTTYYTYDSNRYMIKEENRTYTRTYTIENGNMTKQVSLYEGDSNPDIVDLEYNSDLAPSAMKKLAESFLGTQSTNLHKKRTLTYTSNTTVYNYTWLINNGGASIQRTTSSDNGSDTILFESTCK